MPPRSSSRPAALLLLATLALTPTAVPAASDLPPPEEPWRLMAALRFSEARAAFAERDGATELDQLGRALSLLGAQPRTNANISDAERILAGLLSSLDTEVAARAAFLHARIPHIHRPSTDWAEADRRYLAAFEAHPKHPLGQRAFVRHGIVSLFRPMPPEEFTPLFERFLAGAAALDDPSALRDLDWLLVALHERRLQDPAATLRHVEKLLAGAAPLREVTRASFLVQAGELARELGDRAKAARYYRQFLETATRDSRVYFVRQRLAEVEAVDLN